MNPSLNESLNQSIYSLIELQNVIILVMFILKLNEIVHMKNVYSNK